MTQLFGRGGSRNTRIVRTNKVLITHSGAQRLFQNKRMDWNGWQTHYYIKSKLKDGKQLYGEIRPEYFKTKVRQ